MVYQKRVVCATAWAIILGFIAWALAIVIHGSIPASGIVAIILSYIVTGFVIGISAWKIKWWIHGPLMGLIISIPSGFGAVWVGGGTAFIPYKVVAGIIFGFLIELLTTVVFKAEIREEKTKETPEKKEEKNK